MRQYNDAVRHSKELFSSHTPPGPLIKVGDIFPEFHAIDMDGRIWTNKDAEGKIMVLNVWYTGCKPCLAEMPELSEWKKEMPDVLFFSSTYETPELAAPILERRGFTWTTFANNEQFRKLIGFNGYPLTVVIDRNGKVANAIYGTSPAKRAKLKQTIKSLLQQ